MIRKIFRRPKQRQQQSHLPAQAIITRDEHCISQADVSRSALEVVTRLKAAGFAAYLVGGCVRDLLMRHRPKDFDVATDATPTEVRKIFRNCRLIGRRFRLAHVFFGREIIEVATFRGHDENSAEQLRADDGMIVRDNVYGNIHDDVKRRDFSINALYYDISDNSIVDLTGGVKDLHKKLLRVIGDPSQRYQEDPVRILRAIRFAAKLQLSIHSKSEQPIYASVPLLQKVSIARLFDETVKLYHCGQAHQVQAMLLRYDIFQYLFPATNLLIQQKHPTLQKLIHATLSSTNKRIQQNKPVTAAFLLTAMLWYPMQAETQRLELEGLPLLEALEQAMSTVIKQQLRCFSIPKRLTAAVREIWFLQYRFDRRYGARPYRLLAHPRFRAAYDFLAIRAEIGEVEQDLVDWWTEFQIADATRQKVMIKAAQKTLPTKAPSSPEA